MDNQSHSQPPTPENQAAAREQAPERLWVHDPVEHGRTTAYITPARYAPSGQPIETYVEYVRAGLLQQPVTSERRVECGHESLFSDGGTVPCKKPVRRYESRDKSTSETHADDFEACGCPCVYPATGAASNDLLTTLRAAANYICRARSDYYSEKDRDAIIKALTQ
jgi:hypothetical protein